MRHTILVMDDDAAIQNLLIDLLMAEGYHVKAVDNGIEGLAVLYQSSKQPSLILLDITMPYMDASAFRYAQQHDPDIGSIPVILISGVSDLPEWAAKLNVVDYIAKPLDIDRLLDTVREHCY